MRFAKSPKWLMELFSGLVHELGVEVLPMMGGPTGFTRGRMFSGVTSERIFVRLAEADRAEALALPGAHLFDPFGGKPMREYVVLPAELIEDEEALFEWMRRAERYARDVPLRAKKGAKTSPRKKRPTLRRR